jgi:N-acetylglucosaminyldiphosphoundecaprenol N-acetyl-beta-D-mannosaminyltransferase
MNRKSEGNERLGAIGGERLPGQGGPAAGDPLARRLSRPPYGLLGATGDAVTVDALLAAIRTAHLRPQPTVIAHLNLHGVYLYHRHAEMRQLHEAADLVYFDGMPLVFWARLLGLRVSRQHRVTFLDYKEQLFALADELSWRVFYLGGKPGVAAKAARQVSESYPNLTLRCHHGYLETDADNERVIAQVREFRPQFVLVGMGMPIQEQWLLRNHHHFPSTALIAVGAGFDYLAGEVPTPGRWLGAIGFEWLSRLCSEPRRLSYRYLVEPWFLLPHATRDLLSYRLGVGSRHRPPSPQGSGG